MERRQGDRLSLALWIVVFAGLSAIMESAFSAWPALKYDIAEGYRPLVTIVITNYGGKAIILYWSLRITQSCNLSIVCGCVPASHETFE